MTAAQAADIANATNANTISTLVKRDSSGDFAARIITAQRITGLASPTVGSDAVNKTYADATAAGLNIKTPAVAGTVNANVTLSGGAPNTLDGVSLVADDRVLVKNQTDNTQNGIYFVATLGSGANGTWTRTTDAVTGAELVTGTYIFIAGGTVNTNASYVMTTTGDITLGTSAIVWSLFSQVTQIQAANVLGQIVAAQIADAAINTAKFAQGLTPVEILGTLPVSGNFAGRQVFLTSDAQLYRYDGSAFTKAIPTVNLSGTITSAQIGDNSISAIKIQTFAITNTKISDDAISTSKLQANAVTANTIDANAITAGKIAANAVTAGTIASNAVTAGKIAANAITAGTIASNAVTAGTISAGAVNTNELAAGAITTAKLAAGAVTADIIATNAITAAKIQAGVITADKLVANIITTGYLAASISITTPTILGGHLKLDGASTVSSNTSDGADNSIVRLNGGGSDSQSRGGQIDLLGNEYAQQAGLEGSIILTPSSAANAHIRIRSRDVIDRIRIEANGTITFGGRVDGIAYTIFGPEKISLGWDEANTRIGIWVDGTLKVVIPQNIFT